MYLLPLLIVVAQICFYINNVQQADFVRHIAIVIRCRYKQINRGYSVALSDDGTTVVVGLSECPKLDIMVFRWEHATSTWISLGSPPMREEACVGTHLAWSVATDRHGTTVIAGAHPNSDWVTAYEWAEDDWRVLGDPIDGHYPGSVDLPLDSKPDFLPDPPSRAWSTQSQRYRGKEDLTL